MYQSIRMIILMTRMMAGWAIILVPCIENTQYGRYLFFEISRPPKKKKSISSRQPRLVRLLLQVILLCEDRNPAEGKIRMMLGKMIACAQLG